VTPPAARAVAARHQGLPMKKEMLINVLQSEECRIAIIEDGLLEELYIERASQESYVGNIYKGRIVNIEAGIQAAFVDFGIGRNGFLHASDVDPIYYKHLLPQEVQDEMDADASEGQRGSAGRPRGPGRGDRPEPRRPPPDIEDYAPPRVAEVESSVSLPPDEQGFAAPTDDDGDFPGFGDFGGDAEAGESEPEPAEAPRAERREESPPPRRPTPPPLAVSVPAEPADDDGFGLGLDEDSPPPLPPSARAATPPPVSTVPDEPESVEEAEWEIVLPEQEVRSVVAGVQVVELTQAGGVVLPEAEELPAKPKPRATRKAKPKADDVTEPPAAEASDDEKKPAKPRRSRKKADADADDDKPKPMAGAERRTTAGDDEVEIRPFFTDGPADDFDPDAPNDRFGESVSQDRADQGFEDEPEGDAPPQVDVAVDDGSDDYPQIGENASPASFGDENDPLEYGPPKNRPNERGRGGRPNDRDRGRPSGGGGRGGRPNDRGGRPSDRDRGPRTGSYGGTGGGGMGGRPMSREKSYPRPPIQEIFKRGQEVIVQVIKEAIGTKAPNLSTFISIAGRYLVLMPSLNRVGVSRKIEDMDARRRLREIMNRLNPPKGVGFIVRTAAIDRNETELQNDLAYLLRLWQVVARRIKKMPAPVEIYRESDMITRTIRDNFTSDIDTIWVDEPNSFAQASEFLQIVMPRFAERIRFFSDTEPLFNKYRVDEEIARINNKRIDLPLGGSIIIEQTEALVAIDVNSGNFRADGSGTEETAFQVNLIAAKEIARQLRLRDLGGVIVNDFIDMRSESHRRKVEETLHAALRRDRARTKILRISQFGIIEMTRQRIQQSLKKRIFNECGHCKGTGYIKTNETVGIEVMRLLQLAAHRAPLITTVTVGMHVEAAFYLLNRKRKEIAALEERAKIEVQIDGRPGVSPELLEFRCLDANGAEVRLFGNPPAKSFRGPPPREYRNDRRPPALD
jgi:ribonuclease E